MLALRSALLAGIEVDTACLSRAETWFQSVAGGEHDGLASYEPDLPPNPTMTAIAVLTRCQFGVDRNDPAVVEGVEYLRQHLPEQPAKEPFRTFFIMHALLARGPTHAPWDEWNERVRRSLIESQARSDCAMGSWYLEPSGELWTAHGGRLLSTCLATITLAASYQHLPIHRAAAPRLARAPQTRAAEGGASSRT
jgi:hypothetical protein